MKRFTSNSDTTERSRAGCMWAPHLAANARRSALHVTVEKRLLAGVRSTFKHDLGGRWGDYNIYWNWRWNIWRDCQGRLFCSHAMLWELNAAPNSVTGCAADKQAHGPLPVCKRGWCHSGLTAFEVMMLLLASCAQSVQCSNFPHHLLLLWGSFCTKTHN